MTATLRTLVSFISDSFGGGPNGTKPEGDLIADSDGDLFGTPSQGGAHAGLFGVGDGAVFEIKKTAAGYASAPTTLVSFNGANGATPFAGLIANANGDLFGTASGGGANSEGTVVEITGCGFVPAGSVAAPASNGILFWNTGGQAAIWGMEAGGLSWA